MKLQDFRVHPACAAFPLLEGDDLAAIDEPERGWLYPHLTIHAYVDTARERLLAVGIVKTAELYETARRHWHSGASLDEQRRRGVWLRENQKEPGRHVSFLAVSYGVLEGEGVHVGRVRSVAEASPNSAGCWSGRR